MVVAIDVSDCPTERPRLCLLSVRNMYSTSQLKLRDTVRQVREFMDETLGLFRQIRSQLVDRTEYDALVAFNNSRKSMCTV